jgi:GntR family transcriptional regulator
VDIIISSKSSKPIYEQIAKQIKEMVMNGELQTGDPIPSMRSLAKSLHVSVISVQHAYEDLQRDGFIETTVGRGTYISAQNIEFIREENLKQVEELLQEVADIGKTNGVSLGKLFDLLSMFYKEG